MRREDGGEDRAGLDVGEVADAAAELLAARLQALCSGGEGRGVGVSVRG